MQTQVCRHPLPEAPCHAAQGLPQRADPHTCTMPAPRKVGLRRQVSGVGVLLGECECVRGPVCAYM